MSQNEGTRVQCQVCGRIWVTRAQKKAICTNQQCKSTKILDLKTGLKFNRKDKFIQEQERLTAEKMRLKPKAQPIIAEEKTLPETDVIDVLFEEDGKTPKFDAQEFMEIFKDLPKPSPQIVAIVQNLSYPLADVLGEHWYMAPEQAEFIARAALQVLNEQGVKIGSIAGHWVLLAAVGLYILPNLAISVYAYLGTDKDTTPRPPPPTPVSEPVRKKTPAEDDALLKAEINEQFDEFQEVYHESLNPDGTDKYADRRGIKKPGGR